MIITRQPDYVDRTMNMFFSIKSTIVLLFGFKRHYTPVNKSINSTKFSIIFFQDCGVQLTDEPDKRCYPLDDHLFCHGCHIKRLHMEYPDEQFYIDPYTFNILNKIPMGSQRNSIAIEPALVSAYPSCNSSQSSGNQSSGSGSLGSCGSVGHSMSTPIMNGQVPPPVPPHRKINQNGVADYGSSSPYSPNKPMPQVPTGKLSGMKYTITDL